MRAWGDLGKKCCPHPVLIQALGLGEDDTKTPALIALPSPHCCAELQCFIHYCSPQSKAVEGDVGPEDRKKLKVRNVCLATGKWKVERFRSRCPNSLLEST